MIEISCRIKELRKQKNITQKELAEHLHVSQVAVNYWENGKREPSIDMLKKIANYFGVSLDELMGESIYTPKQIFGLIAENIQEYGNNDDDIHSSSGFIKNTVKYINENDKRQELLDCYDSLNSIGKQEAVKRVSELTEIERYTKNVQNET